MVVYLRASVNFNRQKINKMTSTHSTNPISLHTLSVHNVHLYYTAQTICHIAYVHRFVFMSLLLKPVSCHLLSVQLPGDQ